VKTKKYHIFAKIFVMNIYEKTGDFLFDLAKLIIGAVILGGIMTEGFNTSKLYLYGGIITGIILIGAYAFFRIGQKSKK